MDGVLATKSEGVGLIVRAISFKDFQPVSSWSTNVTDRRTDGRTDDMRSQDRALHYSASRGKNEQSSLNTVWWRRVVVGSRVFSRPSLHLWHRDVERERVNIISYKPMYIIQAFMYMYIIRLRRCGRSTRWRCCCCNCCWWRWMCEACVWSVKLPLLITDIIACLHLSLQCTHCGYTAVCTSPRQSSSAAVAAVSAS